MKYLSLSLVLLLMAPTTVFGANDDDIPFVTASSIPPHVLEAFNKFDASDNYAFSTHLNPFYLQGDFNGDGKLDTAILIKQKTTGKIGFAIVDGASSAIHLIGAGHDFGNGGDNYYWMDAWHTFARGVVSQGAEETAPPELMGDAIMVIKTESASALIYWDGSQYLWYQQGD